MNGKACFRITSVCLLICLFLPLSAQQNEVWIDVAEESLNRDDASAFAAEQCEELQELLFYPINLNRATLAAAGILQSVYRLPGTIDPPSQGSLW